MGQGLLTACWATRRGSLRSAWAGTGARCGTLHTPARHVRRRWLRGPDRADNAHMTVHHSYTASVWTFVVYKPSQRAARTVHEQSQGFWLG